jgi:hypothetical protein
MISVIQSIVLAMRPLFGKDGGSYGERGMVRIPIREFRLRTVRVRETPFGLVWKESSDYFFLVL